MRRLSAPTRGLHLAAASIAALAFAAIAMAGTLTAGTPVQVPDSPLAATPACAPVVARSTAAGSVNYPGAEVEPYVAVDPTNPAHLIGAFQQDRWNDGGANGLIAVVSNNGGMSWTLSTTQPQLTTCQGAGPGSPGAFDRTTDPWVSFSSDGKIAYLIGDSFNANGPAFGGASSIVISRSTDGGVTWQTPVTARLDTSTTVLNDKETVTADSLDPKTAYAAWDRLVSPSQNANPGAFNVSPAFRGPAMFSKTTDGGQTWSTGRPIFDPGEKNQTIGNQIVEPAAGPGKGVLDRRLRPDPDQGRQGKQPALDLRRGGGPLDRRREQLVAADHGGAAGLRGRRHRRPRRPLERRAARVHGGPRGQPLRRLAGRALQQHGRREDRVLDVHGRRPHLERADQDRPVGRGRSRIHAADPRRAGRHRRGRVLRPRERTALSPGLTDTYIVHCHASCTSAASWAAGGETKLDTTGPFDMTTAPDAGGYFVGDYDGLTTSASTFVPFFGVAQPIATAGPTDIFSNRAS